MMVQINLTEIMDMKKLNKILLLTSAVLAFASPVLAMGVESGPMPVVSDLKVKLSAYGHFQAGFVNQNHRSGSEKNVSANRDSFAFFSDAALFADVSNTADDIGLTYGAKIVLVPTAKRKGGPSYNGSHIYMESEFGRVEAGSPIVASSNMSVDASAISSATGGDWDRYAKFNSSFLKQDTSFEPSFATFAEFFLDSKLVTDTETRKYSNEPSRSISYYTPKFEFGQGNKVQVGVSFTPDSANTGADNPGANSSGVDRKDIKTTSAGVVVEQYFKLDKSVKNAVSGGVVLEQNISDGVDVKLALTGETAKAAGKAQLFNTTDAEGKTSLATYKLKDLRTYNIGSVLNFGSFSAAASYGSLGKSLTTSEVQKTGQNTVYYTGGLAYKQGPFSASVTYFRSNQYKNVLDCVTVGTDYKLAPGFKPYAEISGFSLKGKPEFFPDLKAKKTRGTIALIGAKLSL